MDGTRDERQHSGTCSDDDSQDGHMGNRFTLFVQLGLLVFLYAGNANADAISTSELLPTRMTCTAVQTAGFHDFPNNAELYEPVSFYESSFDLKINRVLMRHLNEAADADLYLTLTDADERAELKCAQLRGTGGANGVSCSNTPPSELLLINTETLRFTRTSIGGWTFAAADENSAGDSIYVEYGTCLTQD